MDRRQFLTVGSLAIVPFSGCLGIFDGDEVPDDAPIDGGSEDEDRDSPTGSKESPAILPSIRSVNDYHSGDPITFSGSSDTQSDPFSLEDGFTAVIYEIGDDVDIEVSLIDDSLGEVVDSIESVPDSSVGAVGAGMSSGTYHLEVEADGEWEATVVQPNPSNSGVSTVPCWLSGSGADVFGPFEADGTVNVSGEHTGSGFLVRFFSHDSTSLSDSIEVFTERGPFEGSTEVELDGLTWATIIGDGSYQLMVERS